jgi:hypothetical protein
VADVARTLRVREAGRKGPPHTHWVNRIASRTTDEQSRRTEAERTARTDREPDVPASVGSEARRVQAAADSASAGANLRISGGERSLGLVTNWKGVCRYETCSRGPAVGRISRLSCSQTGTCGASLELVPCLLRDLRWGNVSNGAPEPREWGPFLVIGGASRHSP